MVSSLDHDQRPMENDGLRMRLQTVPPGENLYEFEVEKDPFTFSPGQLSKLINPKDLQALVALGAIPGLDRGLGANSKAGLSIDEQSATNHVTLEEASGRPPLQEPPRWFSKFEHSDSSQFHSRRDEKLVSPTIDNRPSLAVEVRAKCTGVEQGHYSSSEEWETLEAINRTLLDTINHIDDILMELQLWFKRKYKSLNCKKDVTEEQNLVEIIFEFPNNIRHTCTTMPWTIRAALLVLRAGRWRPIISAGQILAEIIFEFPNNIRHTCTTMPWTIRPALLVLWGVCWMFIIGAGQPGHEELEAVNPQISPVSIVYEFDDNCPDFDIEDTLSHSIIDDANGGGYHGQNTLENLLFENIGMMNDPINALAVVQATPQDPDFLAHDVMSRNDAESLGLLERHPAQTLPAAAIQSSLLGPSISISDKSTKDTTSNVVVSGCDNRKTNSDDRVAKTKPRSVCHNCRKTFSRPSSLTRYQVEVHQQNSSGSETLFPCPNSGCNRSSGKSPFKRDSALKRHLNDSKCSQECLARQDDQTYSSTSASTPATQLQEVETEQLARVNGLNKRLRSEDDEGSDESLLVGIWKKYRNMKEEVKQKEDAYRLAEEKLKAFVKDLQDLAGSLSDF